MSGQKRQNSNQTKDLFAKNDAEPEKKKAEFNKNEQITLNFAHTPSLSELDFIVSDANRLAFEHIIAYPNWPQPMSLIIGPKSSGKSHLAKIWQERSNAIFTTKDNIQFIAGAKKNQPILIEDIDIINYDEKQLFHLLNRSIREAIPILMTAKEEIINWPYKTNDLLSRARLATSFFVQAADDEQLSLMFAKLFADRQLRVEPKIVNYLISRMERSNSEVVKLVEIMDKIALRQKRPINRKIAALALEMRAKNLENFDED